MPFSLPPLSRRRFLAGSLAAGLGLMSRQTLDAPAFGSSVNVNTAAGADRLALLSDVHLCADLEQTRRGVCMARNFLNASRQILSLDQRPSHVLINGDLAYLHGRAEDYATAVKLLQPFRAAGMGVHVAMGNHDCRDQFRTALRANGVPTTSPTTAPAADCGGHHVTLLRLPRVNVLMLDSLRTTNRARGRLGRVQLDWLARTLDANPRKPAMVMVHHPPEIGLSCFRGGIADTSELFDVLSPRSQAKALVYGHTHVWSHKQRRDGLHLVNLPTTAYTFGLTQPKGWVHASVHESGATLQLHALNPKHGKNGQRVRLTWRA